LAQWRSLAQTLVKAPVGEKFTAVSMSTVVHFNSTANNCFAGPGFYFGVVKIATACLGSPFSAGVIYLLSL